MSLAPFVPVAATGLAIAFLHAALPTHWLPFLLVGRAQGWAARKTIGVTLLAGAGHVATTVALGALLTGAGIALQSRLGRLFPQAVGGLLILLGGFYIVRHLTAPAHAHGGVARLGKRSDAAAIAGLVTVLSLSPCEAFLPLYLNVAYGWPGFLALSAILLVGTCAAMALFTGLGLAGAERLRLERLERYEAVVIGAALCLLGLFVALER